MEHKLPIFGGVGIISTVVFFLIVVLVQENSIIITDNFSEKKDFRFVDYNPATVFIQNNSFLKIDVFVPNFFANISISNDTGNVECFLDVTKDTPCYKFKANFQEIESGKYSQLPLYIIPNGHNFILKITPILSIVNDVSLSPATWNCQNAGDEYYLCKRI